MAYFDWRFDDIGLQHSARCGHPNGKSGHHSEAVYRARINVDGNISDVRCDSNVVSVNTLARFGLTIRREVDSIFDMPCATP